MEEHGDQEFAYGLALDSDRDGKAEVVVGTDCVAKGTAQDFGTVVPSGLVLEVEALGCFEE